MTKDRRVAHQGPLSRVLPFGWGGGWSSRVGASGAGTAPAAKGGDSPAPSATIPDEAPGPRAPARPGPGTPGAGDAAPAAGRGMDRVERQIKAFSAIVFTPIIQRLDPISTGSSSEALCGDPASRVTVGVVMGGRSDATPPMVLHVRWLVLPRRAG